MDFEAFPKVPRLSREIVVTEKIDGTTASVWIGPDDGDHTDLVAKISYDGTPLLLRAGNRTRWVVPGNDNHGFAAWVLEHGAELVMGLGVGHHFGEWWGSGIQRGYGLPKGEKRFSLFNVGRWTPFDHNESLVQRILGLNTVAPACCHVVPVLYRGPFSSTAIDAYVDELRDRGSRAAPGYQFPEGVVVWHEAARQLFKKTCYKDEDPRSAHAPGFEPAHPGQTKAQAGWAPICPDGTAAALEGK